MRTFLAGIARTLHERRRRDEQGYVLAMAALLLIPLMVISAMSVDFGAWYTAGSRMQKAADAAALAGVVWLPNLTNATSVAKATAKANGYDDAKSNITVTVTQLTDTELKVTVTDTDSPVYLARFLKNSVTISRSATSKYVLPVPLGSPKNYFGTGTMLSGSDRENFYAALNGYCWGKIQGDPFAVRYNSSGNGCTDGSATSNPDYKSPGNQYEYYITVPAGRTQPIVVNIWNPADKAHDSTDPSPHGNHDVTPTFELRAPDATPMNDADNPLQSCTGGGQSNPRTYTGPDNDRTLLGKSGWSDFCTIPTSAPAGRYILGVKNKANESNSNGSQGYALMASYNGSGATCDGRTNSMCPKVTGKNWISILATAPSTAQFFLAEIGPEHAGKTVKITLFDPGEGGNRIRIVRPDGSYASFTAQDMGVDGVTPGTTYSSSTSLDVSGSRYNGKYVELTVLLPSNYNSLYSQWWWKIQYEFSGTVTDRTTWGVRVIGDPVHLTE